MSTMKSKRRLESGVEHAAEGPAQEVVDRLAGLLPEGALEDAVKGLRAEELSGPGGLLSQLAGRVVEAALEAEMTDHLGHPLGGVPSSSNVRNGATSKTLQTDLGPVQIATPRDREGSFESRLVKKRQTGLAGLDDKVLGLYAGGMTVRDISSHLSELYGSEIGRDTISRITDAVLEDVAAWRTRPLETVYPIVYLDAMMVKVREDRSVKNRACYLALGVTCDGEREVLGLWWQETEGAKFWLAVLNDLRQRGVQDVLISCVDGLKGFPEAIEATFPQAWVQTCIVHLIRASLRYVNYRDLKKVASGLRPIYTAPNAQAALEELERFDEQWGARYPAAVQAWRASWEHVTPFLALPEDLRRAVYTTNTIEGLHRQVRKAIKTRGHFPDEQAATKLIYLALIKADAKWQRNRAWTAARSALKIHFGDRYPGRRQQRPTTSHHDHTQKNGQSRVQTCIVHMVRSSLRFVPEKHKKKVAADLRRIYTAIDRAHAEHELERFAEVWDAAYPMISAAWIERFEQIVAFLAFPADVRRVVYTTNTIEALNRQIRKIIKTRGSFPTEDAARKLIFLAITNAQKTWRHAYNWNAALAAFKIHFGDRLPDTAI